MSIDTLILYAAYLAAGLALGAAYFALLAQTVKLHVSAAPAPRIVALYAVRLAGAIAAFWLIAMQGAMPLLLALLGFILVRTGARILMGD